jgi:ATP-binding cassette, subfamily B, multidrug efflux pump
MTNATLTSDTLPQERSPRSSDWRLFLRIVPYARPYGRGILWVTLLLFPLSFAGAVQPIFIGQAISLLRDEPATYPFLKTAGLALGLNLLSLCLLVTVIIRFSLQAFQGYLVTEIGQKITADIRQDLFRHVLSLATRFFDRTPVGKLITRLTSDVEALGDVFATGAIGIISDLFQIVVILALMFAQKWELALLLLMLLVPVTGLIWYFQYGYRKANYKALEERSSLNAMLQENVAGIGIVQLFRREAFNARLFRENNTRYITEVDRTIFYDSAVSATLEWISFIAIAGVLWIGGLRILDETLDFGKLTMFILFAQRLFFPLQQLAEKFTAIQAGFTAVERIQDIFSQSVEIRDPQQPKHLPTHREGVALGEVKFEDVWFAYKEQDYILKGLNFTIQPGEKVAIVGPTGAGKSSIIRLLCRLYDPSAGKILVDGVDVREVIQTDLRRHVGVILQDGFVFAGDVQSNIALGEPYTLEEIERAAQQTNVAPFIEDLVDGYRTVLRERGTNLSAGQKQLLAFARAAIRNPHILVLDEATANLDVGTEALIQEALEKLLADRTAIVIAHRLSTIRNVDRILVLKQGELAESGSHAELIAKNGLYASLYRLQMLGQEL